ncbi:MAG: ABC transporter ATP-binding protein [Candidatus Krumholzibacteriia bacterium]
MDEVIEVGGLSRKFGDFTALTDVTLSVGKGQIFGYLGPNGAGKTTTIRILLGLLKPTGGQVRVLGHDPVSNDYSFRVRLAALLETPGIYSDLSVFDNLLLYSRINQLDDAEKRITELLHRMQLDRKTHEYAGRLSQGMRQKLAIARMLLSRPEVLFFDEPTSGLDPMFQREVREIIKECASQGSTVFLSSHNLHEVQEMCSVVGFIKEGCCTVVSDLAGLFRTHGDKKMEISFSSEKDKQESVLFLRKLGYVNDVPNSSKVELLLRSASDAGAIRTTISRDGIGEVEIAKKSLTLEDIFYIMMGS